MVSECPDELNLKQVAALLGVHYMTAYRYVRTGRMPARREGTGWIVLRKDIEELSPLIEVPATSICAGNETPQSRRSDRWRVPLGKTLSAGDETAAWRIIESALAAGLSPSECYLSLLVGAIDDISGRTACHDAPIAEEYLAMATATRLVARLGARFRRPGRSRGAIVFGAPEGEHHTLAISVVADLVRLEGFSCLELGADVPAEAFAGAALAANRLVAVGIGAATANNLPAVAKTVQAIRRVGETVPIVLGGQAASEDACRITGADLWAADGKRAVEVIRTFVSQRRTLSPVTEEDSITA